MKKELSTKQRVCYVMRRMVLCPVWYVRGLCNQLRWHWQRFQDEQRCHWFHDWMVRRYGDVEASCGAWSWRINGILCSVWIAPMRLKVYHCGGAKTVYYELTDPQDIVRAMREIETIERCTRSS